MCVCWGRSLSAQTGVSVRLSILFRGFDFLGSEGPARKEPASGRTVPSPGCQPVDPLKIGISAASDDCTTDSIKGRTRFYTRLSFLRGSLTWCNDSQHEMFSEGVRNMPWPRGPVAPWGGVASGLQRAGAVTPLGVCAWAVGLVSCPACVGGSLSPSPFISL